MPPLIRTCLASSSKVKLSAKIAPWTISQVPKRMMSLKNRNAPTTPFFTPPQRWLPGSAASKGKGKQPDGFGFGDEEEVNDREWEIRVARGMLHLRESLPHFFHPSELRKDLFPPDIFSQNVILKLPHPLPLKISSLQAYSMAFTLARSGMQALHTDLRIDLSRLTISPTLAPSEVTRPSNAGPTVPAHRQRQIRVLLSAHGRPRLPPHKEATWETSSLYTFSPYSGLIASHEVETIRPLPGEGVAEWLMTRLLGWTSRQHAGLSREGGIPCPSVSVVNNPGKLGLEARLRPRRRAEIDDWNSITISSRSVSRRDSSSLLQ